MSQTKRDSLIETIFSVGSGSLIAFSLNLFFLPLFVDDIANRVITTALMISVFYTGVSMTRSFIFRRIFVHMTEKYKKNIYN
jgi:hypothetical protein|tara:strand:- start:7012 stop:7257 length:246 start_codon:yes stop_codon:yes gene_type:complete